MTKIIFPEEAELNERLIKEFHENYVMILEAAIAVAKNRGKSYQVSPLHHRWTPEGFLLEMEKKLIRIQSTIAIEGWERDPKRLETIMREAPDLINYTGFIAALCHQIHARLLSEDPANYDQIYDPEFVSPKIVRMDYHPPHLFPDEDDVEPNCHEGISDLVDKLRISEEEIQW